MKRWLVTFLSHADGLADVHYVDVTARLALVAVRDAQRQQPPHHPWAVVRVQPWPRGCASVNAAAQRAAGT